MRDIIIFMLTAVLWMSATDVPKTSKNDVCNVTWMSIVNTEKTSNNDVANIEPYQEVT